MDNIINDNFLNNNDVNILNSKYKSFSQNKYSYPISIRIQKTFEKTIPESFDLSNSYKIIQNYNRNISDDLNYNKSNSNISNSISNLDLFQKNESFFIKMRIGETKDKIGILKKNLIKKNTDISTLQEELQEIKLKKENKKIELENLLSNKESFELIYNSLINDNWENNSQRENFNKIKLEINDLENCPIEKVIEQIKMIFKEFSIIYNDNDLNEISNEINNNFSITSNNNLSEEEIINNYLNIINEKIQNTPKNTIPNNQIELIIKYIIKLISLDKRIQDNYNFIFKIYKERKKEIKEKISELINTKELIDEKIEESRNNISKLENKIHLYGQFSRNKVTSNQFRKSFLAKESKTENLKSKKYSISNKNSTRDTVNKNYKKRIIKKELKLRTSPRKMDNLIETISNNINDLSNQIKNQINTSNTFSNRLKIPISNQNLYLKKGIIHQSFCYFKFINKKDKKFNPLSNFDISPEILGYYKGFIYIDFTSNLLLFTPLPNDINLNNIINDESIKINLRQISNIHIETIMRDIIKIYINALKFYKKYEYNNSHYIEENVSLNKFIHLKEFNNIELDTNQRMKATQNKYFPFSISLQNYDNRFEIIFIDYNEFKNWYKGIEIIVNNNKKRLYKNKDEKVLQNLRNTKKNNSFSYNNYYDNLFI